MADLSMPRKNKNGRDTQGIAATSFLLPGLGPDLSLVIKTVIDVDPGFIAAWPAMSGQGQV